MSSPSNLYAEKIFAEHPIAMWSLDESVDYVSLISENDRDFDNWTIVGGESSSVTLSKKPFDSVVNLVSATLLSQGQVGTTQMIGPSISRSSLNFDIGTFSISTYVYSKTEYVTGFNLGYRYLDPTSNTFVKVVELFDIPEANKWTLISETFKIPDEETDFEIFLEFVYLGGDTSSEFMINGTTFGQRSEEFNATSLGVQPSTIPANIPISSPYNVGVLASAYGEQDKDGYYLSGTNTLMAKNSGIPMVYGASSVTILYPNNNQPSLILPSMGFLNDSGRYKQFTAEFWMRVVSDTVVPKRVFGPLTSQDGLYVDGPFLKLVIGKNIGSHYVGEWARPMLVDIRYSATSASLLINGEQVVGLTLDDSIVFPEQIVAGKSQEWLGFYAYEDVSPIEIDAVAIYSYEVPSVVSKRRWVYGQGVKYPENIEKAYSGTSVVVDYGFAQYSKNQNYPAMSSFSDAIVSNLSTVGKAITAPNYSLPEVIFQTNKTLGSWYSDLASVQNEDDRFVTFKTGQTIEPGYILFNNINMLVDDTAAIYGIFKIKDSLPTSEQVLMLFEDQVTLNTFTIAMTNNNIEYRLKYGSTETVVYEAWGTDSSDGTIVGDMFTVGFHIDKMTQAFGGNLLTFFGNKSQISLYIGGDKTFTKTFAGNIYTVAFCNDRNFSKIESLFGERGLPLDYENVFDLYQSASFIDGGLYNTTLWEYVLDGGSPNDFITSYTIDHTPSYGLIFKEYLDTSYLDIAIDGYWEDYIPMRYFAKYVNDDKGKPYYDVDFVQVNIDYPAPSMFYEEETTSSWTYEQLQAAYDGKTYELLSNHLYTGYDDYTDLMEKSVKIYNYDTSLSHVRTYITFQYLDAGVSQAQSYFTSTAPAPKNNVIVPGSDWMTTKYEIVNNAIVYLPKNVNVADIAIVTHIEVDLDGINTNPVAIKKLEYAAQSMSQTSPAKVGSRFGVPLYPFKKSGVYYDYKNSNPFSIYKGSTPYLYLNRYSGIEVRGDVSNEDFRGLYIPVNEFKSDNYKVIAMQAAVRYDQDFFSYGDTQIFEIQDKLSNTIKFYMTPIDRDGKRAKIYAINAKTGSFENGIGFYVNGKIVKDPIITVKEWMMLGISFGNTLEFSNYVGGIRLVGPLLFNNISFYQSTNLQEVSSVAKRPWLKVKQNGIVPLDWFFWNVPTYNWNRVLVLSDITYYGVDPQDLFKAFTGTNKFISGDNITFRLKNYKYRTYDAVSWQSQQIKPA
jgi:hypothetical protein